LEVHAEARPIRHQVIEIPESVADISEFRLHPVQCACGATTCAELPVEVPRGMMGPRLVALVALLTANCHVSRRKEQQFFKDVLGVESRWARSPSPRRSRRRRCSDLWPRRWTTRSAPP
jgi:hypothetical protein